MKKETKEVKPLKQLKDEELKSNLFDVLKPPQKTDNKPDAKETIDTWLNDKYLHSKTALTPNQVVALTILKTLAEKYKVKCIKKLLDNFVRYKLSEGRKSSEELVKILMSQQGDDLEMQNLTKQIAPFIK